MKTTFVIKDSIKAMHKQETSLFEYGVVGLLVTLFFSMVDYLTLYDMLDKCFTMSAYATMVVCGSFALILNFLGYFMAQFAVQYEMTGKCKYKKMIFCCAFAFVLAYTTVTACRVLLIDSGAETVNAVSGLAAVNTGETNREAIARTLLMSVSPLLTTFICFTLGSLADPKRARQKRIEKNIVYLTETMSAARCRADALGRYDAGKELAEENESYESFCKEIENHGEMMKERARQILLKQVGSSPEKVTTVTNSAAADVPQR